MTYTVLWSENDEPEYAGSLELTPSSIVLSGMGAGPLAVHREVRYVDLTEAYLERRTPARLPWEPALVLVTRNADRIAVGSLEGLGALHELADSVSFARRKPVA